jgi:hypothetical protein
VPSGLTWTIHDPRDESRRAYLASTRQGHRIYLDRLVTDADFVVPVGPLSYDPILGYQGPWGMIYPGLSDAGTIQAVRSKGANGLGDRPGDRPALAESTEVSWLLGSQFQVGLVVAASGGAARVIAGEAETVRREGMAAVDDAWCFATDQRAAVVVVGVGRSEGANDFEQLARALDTGARLVRRGGKIVALSQVGGPLGPALQRLAGCEDPTTLGMSVLKNARDQPDFVEARMLARSLNWADIYLWSGLDHDVAEDLALVPLGRPEEARRLVNAADSVLFVSYADLTRPLVSQDE